MHRLLIAVLAASTVVSLSNQARAQEEKNGLPIVTIMHGGVTQLNKDMDFLLKLAGPKAAAQLPLIAGIIPAFTDGIDLTQPVTVDIILNDPRDYRISLPIDNLKSLLSNIGGFAGAKARQVARNKFIFKGAAFNGVAIVVDANGDKRTGPGDYLVLAQDEQNIPDDFTPLTAIKRLNQYHLAASVTNTADGAEARKAAIDTIRDELNTATKRLPNETEDQLELRRVAQNHRIDELERLFVDSEELVLGWLMDYEGKEGQLELQLSALPDTQLARDIAAMGEDPSLFTAVVRADDATVFGRLNHRLDAMRQGNITQFLSLIEKQVVKRIDESTDLDDDSRAPATAALKSFLGMLQDGNSQLGRIDGILQITETTDGRTLSGGIRAPCGTTIAEVLKSLKEAGWDVNLEADAIGEEAPPVIGDPPAAADANAEETETEPATEKGDDDCPQVGPITIHEVKIPVSREFDFAGVFGTDTMLVAASSNVVYYAIGHDAAAAIRKAVKVTGEHPDKEDGTFFEVWYRIGPWIKWGQERAARLGPDPDLTEDEKKAHAELEALGKRAQTAFGDKLDAIYTKLQVIEKDDRKVVSGDSTIGDGLLGFVGAEIAKWAKENLQ